MEKKNGYQAIQIHENDSFDLKPQPKSICGLLLNFILTLLTLFLGLLPLWASFFTVNPQEEVLVLFYGKLNKVVKEQGIHWYNLLGRSIIRISTRTQTFDIKKTTVLDGNGNPIIVSGVVTYKVSDSIRAAFGVSNVRNYLETQALASLKKVCSRYPYESKDGHSLQKESDAVSREMVAALQTKADICGCKILGYELCDLQYAPEIAQGMLVRQQAQALLDARKVIVEGAVGIVSHAMMKLMETGVKFNDKEQSRLVGSLLTVICADAKVQPTFNVSEMVDSEGGNAVQEEMLKTLRVISMNTTRPQ